MTREEFKKKYEEWDDSMDGTYEDESEEKALDALTKQIEDFLKEPVITSGNY